MRTLFVFGTRPEAIKLAPVVHAARAASEFETIVAITGQHREMLAQVTDYFGIEPDVSLDLMQPNQTLNGLMSRCLDRLDIVLQERKPECVVAQGDTTTVAATAIAAFHRRIPFVHVEAGLRTGNLYSPWPEEFNRRTAGLLATLHCPPTEDARQNLLKEGVRDDRIHVTGNTVIDALLWTVERERGRDAHWLVQHPWMNGSPSVLITAHRRENFGGGFEAICHAIATLAERHHDTQFVYPVHLNPNVQEPVRRLLGELKNVHLLPPASYPEFVWLMDRCHVILTDSGGVQEEAPSLRKPVLVMRDTTERPEAIAAGAAELVGTEVDRIVERVSLLLTNADEYRKRQIDHSPYGDGRAAQRIVELLPTVMSLRH